MQVVEVDDEDAIRRVRGKLKSITLRVRVAALPGRIVLRVFDELERLDLLKYTVLEDLEVVGGQSVDDPAVARGIRVDANEVDALYGTSASVDPAEKSSGSLRTGSPQRHRGPQRFLS